MIDLSPLCVAHISHDGVPLAIVVTEDVEAQLDGPLAGDAECSPADLAAFQAGSWGYVVVSIYHDTDDNNEVPLFTLGGVAWGHGHDWSFTTPELRGRARSDGWLTEAVSALRNQSAPPAQIDIHAVLDTLIHRYDLDVTVEHTGGGRMVATITAPRREPLAFGPFLVRSERWVGSVADLTYGPPSTADGPLPGAVYTPVPASTTPLLLAALLHVAAYDRPFA